MLQLRLGSVIVVELQREQTNRHRHFGVVGELFKQRLELGARLRIFFVRDE